MRIAVRLTGPREGQTVVLNGVRFVEGWAVIDAGALRYFTRCYKVVPYGAGNNEADAHAGKREEVPSQAEVQPIDDGTPKKPADDSGTDDGATDGSEGNVPDGDGHEDPRVDWLREALSQLDPEDDSQWTQDGRPRVDALSRVTGRMVTREMVQERFSGGERYEAAGQGQQPDEAGDAGSTGTVDEESPDE